MNLDQVVFLTIASVGAAFLLISFIVGEIGDTFDSVGDFVGAHLGFGDSGGDGGLHADDGPNMLSLRNLMAFFTAYGASGLITSAYGWSVLSSSLFGLVPGTLIAAVAFKFMQALYGQQSNSLLSVDSLVGKVGIIDLAIPPAGIGKVSVHTDTGTNSFLARSEGGAPIATGERVVVKGLLGSDLIVSKVPETS